MNKKVAGSLPNVNAAFQGPTPFTGKTLTVASSNGNKPTEATINGLPVIVGVNAYIKPER